jgi:DNA-binding CsgD family transcriptional regulator
MKTVRLKGDIPQHLTTRQKEIVLLIAQGLSYGEMADRLGISIQTMKNHCRSIHLITGCPNNLTVVAQYWKQKYKKAYDEGYRHATEQLAS